MPATPWTHEQAQRELDAWRASGQSVEAFAKERRVAAHRLRYWQKRLTELSAAPAKKKPLSLLPVRVSGSDAPIELVLSNALVARIRRGFDEETLLRLVMLFGQR